MSFDQIFLFALFAVVIALLIWGRYRYDLVAFAALIVAVVVGVVPTEDAFAGFGHPATIIVAVVLVVSRGLVNSGAVAWILRTLVRSGRSLSSHIAIMATIGAALSAFMNNVATLALLMPVDLSASAKAGRSPGLSLMPLSFATILGGMVTLIGTPPNIIIAAFREQTLGESFAMFAFAPVGLAVAVVGVAYVALVGWRLIPAKNDAAAGGRPARRPRLRRRADRSGRFARDRQEGQRTRRGGGRGRRRRHRPRPRRPPPARRRPPRRDPSGRHPGGRRRPPTPSTLSSAPSSSTIPAAIP